MIPNAEEPERPRREPSEAEKTVISELYNQKEHHEMAEGYITTTAPIPMGSKDKMGPWGPNPDRIIPAGQTLRIVMVSRFNDCGLIDNLDATHGYEVRLPWDDAAMSDIRLTKEPTP